MLLFTQTNGEKMNIYDTKQINCVRCGKCIGEVDYDSKIINAQCGQCSNPLPEGDKILYTISHFQSKIKNRVGYPELMVEV